MIRGTCILPEGTGKEIKICVFADSEMHAEIKAAGADAIGDDHMLQSFSTGDIPYDKIICTPEQIASLKKLARVLGPKGLMPNVKSGTLVKPDELVETVRQSKSGLIEFRINSESFIQSKIGMRRFNSN